MLFEISYYDEQYYYNVHYYVNYYVNYMQFAVIAMKMKGKKISVCYY